jgi:hypothetical protein
MVARTMDNEKDNVNGHADEQKKVLKLGLGILFVLAAVAAVLYFAVFKKPAAPPAATKAAGEAVKPPAGEPAAAEGKDALVLPAVGLDQSDSVVREYARAISSSLRFGQWLESKELVRKFVVAVDNIANGMSPKPHVDFWAPAGPFKTVNKLGGTIIDESKYSRYDPVAEVIVSLNTEAAVRFYRALRPLIRDAYRDLGYPDTDFSDTLVKAMGELLETPIVEGPIKLEKKILSYQMVDASLEGLSPAQKQLLRMGPKNVRAIQGKIRELAAALGIPESKLPRTKVLSTGGARP